MKKSILISIIIGLVIIVIVVIVGFILLIPSFRTSTALPPTLDLNMAVAELVDSFTATPQLPSLSPTEELTSTPRPTLTPLPSMTISVTPSPYPTRTPHPTLTPTFATQNPGGDLGDPTWLDEFDNENHWTLFDDECFRTDITAGKYIQTTNSVPAGACWEVTWPRIQDYYLETVARVPGSCDERDRFGIYFRGLDTKRGYLFGVTCKGEYWLSFWNSKTNRRETLIDYTEDEKIKIGSGDRNKLGILTSGDRIVLYINDALLAEVYDSTFTQEGLIGLFIGAEVTQGFTVEYDYLAYWSNP